MPPVLPTAALRHLCTYASVLLSPLHASNIVKPPIAMTVSAVVRTGESKRVPALVHVDHHEEAAPVASAQHGRRAAVAFARRLGRRGQESGRHLLHGGAFRCTLHCVDEAGQSMMYGFSTGVPCLTCLAFT